jgi:acetylornithine/succinyldiaminopimelate/putrescine aminotransferase
MKISFTMLTGAGALALCLVDSAWAQAPTVHFTTFAKQASNCACHLFARSAMQKEHLNIAEDAGSVLLGNNNQVVVEAICLPDGQHVRVSAFSQNSKTAELARNNIRASIVGAHLFDTCP